MVLKMEKRECQKNVLHRINSVSIISDLGRISGRHFSEVQLREVNFYKKNHMKTHHLIFLLTAMFVVLFYDQDLD